MARPEKKKIAVDGGAAFGSSLAGAFGDLPLGDLPEGPEIAPEPPLSPAKSPRRSVTLRKETAHRGGKAVIVLYDFTPPHSSAELDVLAKNVRRACGCGGTVKEETIEIQGDQPVRIREILTQNGYRVRGI